MVNPRTAKAVRDGRVIRFSQANDHIIAALVGAKLMLVVVDFDYFRSNPRELLSLVRVGGVFYGGLIGSFLVG